MKPKLINRIYLCGPLEGRTVAERYAWRDHATTYLGTANVGIETYIPGEDTTRCDARTVTALDYMMIDNSEALLVDLTCLGEDKPTNTGTLIEIGYARAKGKLIVAFTKSVWKRENRFLRGTVDVVFEGADSFDDALEYIAGFNRRRRNTDEV